MSLTNKHILYNILLKPVVGPEQGSHPGVHEPLRYEPLGYICYLNRCIEVRNRREYNIIHFQIFKHISANILFKIIIS